MHSPKYGPDPTSPHTTFVQADPSNFRAIVQKLTGASEDPSTQKLPLTLPSRGHQHLHTTPKPTPTQNPPPLNPTRTTATTTRPAFKLHERRQRKLEIQLSNTFNDACHLNKPYGLSSPSSAAHFARQYNCGSSNNNNVNGMVMVSPVSPLDLFAARASPRTPVSSSSCEEEEERAIAEKGFYLHPSPRNTPRGSDPPELLPLFPLHSPRDNDRYDK